jgi:hypothetical protein
MNKITKLSFPLQLNAVPLSVMGGWVPVIAGLQDHEIKDLLMNRWSAFQEPYLQHLSAAVLNRELLCLSIDSGGYQWLSFEDDSSALHVAPPCALPNELRTQFPFNQIPGLSDFVENFGGLANRSLPLCPWFIPVHECHIVSSECKHYDWGMIGNWAGSLPLYNTGTGNFIVVSPDNRCAKWDHEFGWGGGGSDPFYNLNWTMSDLVEEFVMYLSLGQSEAEDSPFYY